ncbi:transcription factor bHLH162 isoform X2 [Setaria italica]|uniref:transcription factor bHLH162 isoform X2 n=1 Tax=Setaria italica TaxID=4555 RepID=UPI000BE51FD0|nr:transcription factor bHLH162 isoform X2 [Setaria italica]
MEMGAKKSRSSDTATAGRRSSTSNSSGASAVARKEIERRRRQHMKSLCVKLASLIPREHFPRVGSLNEAAAYIKKLKERVDDLQQKRSSAQLMAAAMRGGGGGSAASTSAATVMSGGGGARSEEAAEEAPVVEVLHRHDDGSSLDVVLVSGVERSFKLHEVVTVLEEEGAEIINANLSVADRKVFHTIHCRAFSPRIGIEVSRVSERLRALI